MRQLRQSGVLDKKAFVLGFAAKGSDLAPFQVQSFHFTWCLFFVPSKFASQMKVCFGREKSFLVSGAHVSVGKVGFQMLSWKQASWGHRAFKIAFAKS